MLGCSVDGVCCRVLLRFNQFSLCSPWVRWGSSLLKVARFFGALCGLFCDFKMLRHSERAGGGGKSCQLVIFIPLVAHSLLLECVRTCLFIHLPLSWLVWILRFRFRMLTVVRDVIVVNKVH